MIPDWAKGIHPQILAELSDGKGGYREPCYEEWTEDYGLGYRNRLLMEGKKSTEEIRKTALAKLTQQEKRALGLTP
jgi:hypothetical protein